jgi:hypothetical protein
MSIATLKRKTNTKYNNMSVGLPQFSLNGYYRNDRSLPSTNRTQTSIPRTIARGNQYRGYGGLNGAFNISVITPLCEQPNAEQALKIKNVKISTKNTSGLIAKKYLWTKLPNPYTWVKRSGSTLNNACSTYTANLTKQAVKTIVSIPKPQSATLGQCNFIQNPDNFVAMQQGLYVQKLGGDCVNGVVNKVYDLPTNLASIPILGGGNVGV